MVGPRNSKELSRSPPKSQPSGATRRTAVGLLLGAPLLGACSGIQQTLSQFSSPGPAQEPLVAGTGQVKVGLMLPLSAPGIVASAIFSFTLAWNEFLLALVFTSDQTTMTVPIKLSMMVVGDQYIWGQLMAGAVLATVPITILYFLGQRFVVQGLAAGSVKG